MSSIRLLRYFLPKHPPGSADDRRRDPIQAGFLLLAPVLAGAMFLFRWLDAGWVAATMISLLACLAYVALPIAFQRNLDRAVKDHSVDEACSSPVASPIDHNQR